MIFRKTTGEDPFHLPIVRKSLLGTEPPTEGKGLRLAIYQGQSWVGDKEAIRRNLENLEKRSAAAADHGAQLLAQPELFLSGYNITTLAQRDAVVMPVEEAVEKVAPIAISNRLAIVCPYPEVAIVNGKRRCFDAMILVDKDGKLLRNYRKTQLWGNDEKTNWWFPYVEDPEAAYEVVQVNGIKIGLLNCYEAEFPELSRILAMKGAQLIVIPTAADVGTADAKGVWSDWAYPDVSKTAIPANAYGNGIFVAYVNHSLYEYLSDGTLSGVYLGNSVVADPYGKMLVHADNVETLLIADCVPGAYQTSHPDGWSDYIKDRRPPLYEELRRMSVQLPGGEPWTYPEDPNDGWHPDD